MVMWWIFFGFGKNTKLILVLSVNVFLRQCQMYLCYLHGNVNPRVAGHFSLPEGLELGLPLGFSNGLELGFRLGLPKGLELGLLLGF
jgi:hypothetical protein